LLISAVRLPDNERHTADHQSGSDGRLDTGAFSDAVASTAATISEPVLPRAPLMRLTRHPFTCRMLGLITVFAAGCAFWLSASDLEPRAFRHAWTDAWESCIVITHSLASLHCNTAQAECSDTGWRAMKGYV
jgi:hypothetical protein